MIKSFGIGLLAGALVMSAMPATRLAAQPDKDDHELNRDRHVLLISIDGMHAVDYANCAKAPTPTCPTLAALGMDGVNYTRTSTSRSSDSFPGLMALVTGGTPKTVGAFYDVAWDRVLAPPAVTTGNGLAAGPCNKNQINGTQTEYEEGDEIDQTKVNGGGPYASPIDGGILSLEPARFIRDPFSVPTPCMPVYPWNFIRTNTIYGVIHAAGGYTAWSDKHAVYAAVSGPTGTSSPSNVDDYYSPEVNSNQVPLPVTTAGTKFNCETLVPNGGDFTTDFQAIQCYDQLKVNAVVNWIHGKAHLGGPKGIVPAIFGMNFQAVSVGEKLIENGVFGGYTDAAADPTPSMASEIKFVDAAIGEMVAALDEEHLLNDTTIIITAKHGQSPIDKTRFFPIPGPSKMNGESPANILLGKGLVPAVELAGPGPTEDDISQIWLSPGADTVTAVNDLEAEVKEAGIGEIFYGDYLTTMFNAPGVPDNPGPCCFKRPGGDPRTPDIIVEPNVGVVYTGSSSKQSEHGGYAQDDTDVMLLVSNPSIKAKTVTSWVETMQVAPTILQLLGLDPSALDAVRMEGTQVLPGLFESDENESDHN